MVISTGVYGNCDCLFELLRVQHEYSKFVTMREVNSLASSDDFEYCEHILECIPNINIDSAKKEILKLMEYDEENGTFDGCDWDYNMLDEILMFFVGKDLYKEY